MAGTLILFIGIVAATVLIRFLVSKNILNRDLAKKLLHISAISISAFSVFIGDYTLILWIVLAATPVVFLLVALGVFNSKDHPRKSWGIFYFTLVFLLLLYLFPHQRALIFFPLITLALADGLAAITGLYFGKHRYRFGPESKSIEGSAAFLISSIFCLQFLPEWLPFVYRPFTSVFTVLIVSVFLTLTEAISIKGRDNLWVPLALLYWLLLDTYAVDLPQFVHFLLLAAAMYFIYRMKWLTAGGAIAASLLGWTLIISPHPVWVLPAVVFLMLGSILTKLPRKQTRNKGSARNANQVFYNGGFYVIFLGLYFISNQEFFLVGAMASLTAAMSDTAASEMGSRYAKNTINITTGKRVAPGLSGGISLIGSVAGILFAGIFAFLPFLIQKTFDPKVFFIVFGIGILGNLFDSILGSLFQIKYRQNPKMPWSDQNPGTISSQKRGFAFVTNDVVNLLTTATMAFLGTTLFILL